MYGAGAPPFQAPPFGQRPNASGHPVGAVFLGFFVSVVASLLYSGFLLIAYKDQSVAVAVVAAPAAMFGYTNGLVLISAVEESPMALRDLLE
ncbi:hypothetical protein ABZ078_24270 [Streptomyces sp. NPDC006385]|uniref:hypothetical protein n=1 Tax=Streptomyces sp. NPDC006385 TaxID=3156761 RepID=UPI0033B0FCBB